MAIIKHIASKNSCYDDVYTYLKYEHERHVARGRVWYTLLLDDYGLLKERRDCAMYAYDSSGNPIPPECWASACERTNLRYAKPANKKRRKNHTYIVSLPQEDRLKTTKEDFMETAQRMAKEFFVGYEVLIAIHFDDGKNPHMHLVINSIRAEDRSEAPWMMRTKEGDILPCEVVAGGMHQDSSGLRKALNDWMLSECRKQGWIEQDNNAIAENRKQEYTRDKNAYLRNALTTLVPQCRTWDELSRRMKENYGIEIRRRGKTISLLHPDSKKAVRITTLGLDPTELFQHMENDKFMAEKEEERKKKYVDWVKARRKRNEEKAKRLQRKVEAFLREKEDVQSYSSGWDDRDDFKRMIYHTTNLAAVLETEKEKADRLLSAWEISLDSSRDVKTRATNREFVMWCGCDPDDEVEHQWLIEQRECIDLEEKMAIEMSAQLVAEYDQRRSYSEMNELERDSLWLQRREDQLKHQIKYLKKRSKKLWAISCNCERAAMRRTPWSTNDFYQNSIPKGWENYYRCRGQWTECNIRLYELEKRLMDVRRTRKRVSKFTELE